jgi:DNA-binding MarR family transcriptional regulator
MGGRLKAELRQTKPFSSLAEEALLNLERTADRLKRDLQQTLKPFGLTSTQYNALRILRGAAPNGLTCSQLGERLVSADPDITRLLLRLARQGLITRRRGPDDKRVVLTRISAQGLALLESLVPITDDAVRQRLAHLSESQLQTLIDLLEEARSSCGTDAGQAVNAEGACGETVRH